MVEERVPQVMENGHSLVIHSDIETSKTIFIPLPCSVRVCTCEGGGCWEANFHQSFLKESGNLVRKRLQMDKALTSNFTIKEQRDEFTTALPEEPDHSTTPGRDGTQQPPQNKLHQTNESF